MGRAGHAGDMGSNPILWCNGEHTGHFFITMTGIA
jgi:hypothetical protein